MGPPGDANTAPIQLETTAASHTGRGEAMPAPPSRMGKGRQTPRRVRAHCSEDAVPGLADLWLGGDSECAPYGRFRGAEYPVYFTGRKALPQHQGRRARLSQGQQPLEGKFQGLADAVLHPLETGRRFPNRAAEDGEAGGGSDTRDPGQKVVE